MLIIKTMECRHEDNLLAGLCPDSGCLLTDYGQFVWWMAFGTRFDEIPSLLANCTDSTICNDRKLISSIILIIFVFRGEFLLSWQLTWHNVVVFSEKEGLQVLERINTEITWFGCKTSHRFFTKHAHSYNLECSLISLNVSANSNCQLLRSSRLRPTLKRLAVADLDFAENDRGFWHRWVIFISSKVYYHMSGSSRLHTGWPLDARKTYALLSWLMV